ncbi:MAG TPA: ABC transporter permease [Fulvivirga sp.]|nr:ABC transporter permease [Fulvivirga sp.]
MIKNYLKITFRSLWKRKGFVTINVLGLAVAISCCIVAYLNFDYNQKFDVEHKNADKIYRINSKRIFQDRTRLLGYTPRPMGRIIEENIKDIDKLAQYERRGANIRIGDDFFGTGISYVDPNFLEMFTFEMVSGSVDLTDNSNIYISDDLAIKYFGQEDPLGKSITHVLDSGVRDYVVAGVFKKQASNSSFMFVEAITNYDNYFLSYKDDNDKGNWQVWNTTFIELKDPSRIPIIEKQLQAYIEPQNKAREDFQITSYYLDPFKGMAIRDEKLQVGSSTREGLPSAAVMAPLIMSGLLLLLACFNFTNTSIAISGTRLKEIGLRKVMGGLRSQLIRQFLVENILLCLMAMIIGLIIAEFFVPAYSQMWDFLEIKLSYTEDLGLIGFLFLLLIITGVIAGSYPAFYISKFEPVSILKGTQKFGGTSPFTKTLLSLQLTIALLAIIASVAFVRNAQYQNDFDLGYEGDGIIHVVFNNTNDYEIYKNAVVNDPRILSYSGTEHQLMESYRNDPVKFEDQEEEVDILNVDDNYLKTMDMRLLEGRNFNRDSETDIKESIIVTKKFARLFNWDNPIGKRIVWADTVQLFVVGVVDDIYTNALWRPLEPLMFRLADKKDYRFLSVNTKPSQVIAVNSYMEAKWKEIFPNKLYNGEYLNVDITEAALVNNNILKMFGFLGSVALILSISGLFTLVSLNIIKRLKEVAIRKVLGASIGSIAVKLNKQFIIIILIAIALSSLMSYFMIGGLMSSIWAYHVSLGAMIFIASGLVFLLISVLTVGSKVYGAAAANPVDSLRNE